MSSGCLYRPGKVFTMKCGHWALALALPLLLCAPAWGALGDDVATIAVDRARLHAALTVSHRGTQTGSQKGGQTGGQTGRYAIHELAMPSGVRLRHFVNGGGKVFAVSWSGGWRPNLRDIMGTHYDDFIAATRGKPMKRGVARIETRGMVVVMGGHQRAFFGHVYLTDLLPEGFLDGNDQLGPDGAE